jgi:hypothetical protein
MHHPEGPHILRDGDVEANPGPGFPSTLNTSSADIPNPSLDVDSPSHLHGFHRAGHINDISLIPPGFTPPHHLSHDLSPTLLTALDSKVDTLARRALSLDREAHNFLASPTLSWEDATRQRRASNRCFGSRIRSTWGGARFCVASLASIATYPRVTSGRPERTSSATESLRFFKSWRTRRAS